VRDIEVILSLLNLAKAISRLACRFSADLGPNKPIEETSDMAGAGFFLSDSPTPVRGLASSEWTRIDDVHDHFGTKKSCLSGNWILQNSR
jgi:hypothetical protein